MKNEEINLNQLDYKFSLGLLGDTESGKTSIFHYITYEEPLWEPPFRTGPDRNKIFISIKNKAIKIILYDTPGQERYRSISIGSLREVQALLLVFSLSKIQYFSQREDMLNPYKKNLLQKKYTSKAFNIVKLYLDEILSLNQQEKKLIYLIGNKCDDIENRLIKTEDAKSFAKENNLKYYEISAKTGKNIKNILGNIILDLMEKYPNQLMNKNDKIKVNKNNKKKTFNLFFKTNSNQDTKSKNKNKNEKEKNFIKANQNQEKTSSISKKNEKEKKLISIQTNQNHNQNQEKDSLISKINEKEKNNTPFKEINPNQNKNPTESISKDKNKEEKKITLEFLFNKYINY